MRNRLDDASKEVKDLEIKVNNSSNMRPNNLAPKMLFEVLRYRYESAKEKDVPHVITFEEASYNVGHAMNEVTGG